jgi:hypothetical protein
MVRRTLITLRRSIKFRSPILGVSSLTWPAFPAGLFYARKPSPIRRTGERRSPDAPRTSAPQPADWRGGPASDQHQRPRERRPQADLCVRIPIGSHDPSQTLRRSPVSWSQDRAGGGMDIHKPEGDRRGRFKPLVHGV